MLHAGSGEANSGYARWGICEALSEERDASSRFPWPPAIFLAGFVVATAARALIAAPMVGEGLAGAARVAGGAIIAAGLALALAAEWRFFRARTGTLPTSPTRVIVETGVYRYTRNPMYLGMALVIAGLTLFLNSWWFVVVEPFLLIAVYRLAIVREEAYLERNFGAEYQAYKARVRRWL